MHTGWSWLGQGAPRGAAGVAKKLGGRLRILGKKLCGLLGIAVAAARQARSRAASLAARALRKARMRLAGKSAVLPMHGAQGLPARAAPGGTSPVTLVGPAREMPRVALLYPADRARPAQTLVYRMGGAVGKVALGPSAEARLANEYAVLSGPLGSSRFFPRVYGIGRVRGAGLPPGGALCLREEFVEGLDLGAYARRCAERGWRTGPRDVAGLLAQLLSALARVHEAGWVHRDLHPGNVVVSADGTLRLIDFGVAARADECAAGLHREGIVSRGFEPPESAAGGPWSPASDVYSACLMASELLKGAAGAEAPPSPAFRAFLDRGLSADPGLRWEDGRAALEALLSACGPW